MYHSTLIDEQNIISIHKLFNTQKINNKRKEEDEKKRRREEHFFL